ncbi:MAG: glycoside hydrolase family 2, partial [Thermoanaerobaculia bacterium]|nr:glycoside hydrolase family 2 [Thermoanaerobaculia bacterium]
GGIFRPVFLESTPRQAILKTAVDARHDGRLDVTVTVATDAADRVVAHVETLDGTPLGGPFGGLVGKGTSVRLATDLPQVAPWSPESPSLYRLVTELRDGKVLLHRHTNIIGFRSFEVRPGQGLFLNGRRILLRGVNRHSFHPETGRATSPELSRSDIELMKSLNMNAVRSAHYPPDRHFLELCDSLGMLVVDELPGWHDAYYTESGRPLVQAMVEHDRNHPSVVLWANGNEGGSNVRLDPLFRLYDPQKRPVIHPDTIHGGFDTHHYPNWQELDDSLQGRGTLWQRLRRKVLGAESALVLPTEMLHGLYDGGNAAGLDAYWTLIESSPRGAGGFLWALFDEAVVRTDQDGHLDSNGSHGPDGLTGPYRELEGGALGVQEIWAPVRISGPAELDRDFEGRLTVENLFHSTNLDRTLMEWELIDFPSPGDEGSEVVLARGSLRPPAIAPGMRGEIALPLPQEANQAEALRLSLLGPQGRRLRTWVLALESGSDRDNQPEDLRKWIQVESEGDFFVLRSDTTSAVFSRQSGQLVRATVAGRSMALSGPRAADWQPGDSSPAPGPAGLAVQVNPLGDTLEVRSQGPMTDLRWRMDSDGWLELSYALVPDVPGLGFDLDPDSVQGIRWLGDGPFRTWANRPAGRRLGLWYTAANDTRTGVDWDYPEMRGYYSGIRWAMVVTEGLDVTMDSTSDTSRYLQLLHPSFGPEPRHSSVPFPEPQLSILHWIPGIGTKFHPWYELAQGSLTQVGTGTYGRVPAPPRGRVRLRFSLHQE